MPQRLTNARVSGGTLRRPLHDLLLQAMESAVASLSRGDGSSEATIRAQLAVVVRHIDGLSGNGTREQARGGGLEPLVVAPPHYLMALRQALLAAIVDSEALIDGVELATVLSALEDAPAAPSAEGHHDFSRHLASADAVNAVVEIAHDMRSPLTSILFLVDTLRRAQSGAITSTQERQLGLIYGAALGLNTLASDVIDAVRGGQRLVDGEPVPFSVSEVVLAVCDTVRPISEEKKLPVHCELPAKDGRMGYPAALSRVLLNLVTNALKYTDRGEVSVRCQELDRDLMSFVVQDTGAGIPPHVMDLLFDGFRPSASGMRFSNAGLGLSICRNFLQAMDSTLEVESGATGTRFSFSLTLPAAAR